MMPGRARDRVDGCKDARLMLDAGLGGVQGREGQGRGGARGGERSALRVVRDVPQGVSAGLRQAEAGASRAKFRSSGVPGSEVSFRSFEFEVLSSKNFGTPALRNLGTSSGLLRRIRPLDFERVLRVAVGARVVDLGAGVEHGLLVVRLRGADRLLAGRRSAPATSSSTRRRPWRGCSSSAGCPTRRRRRRRCARRPILPASSARSRSCLARR